MPLACGGKTAGSGTSAIEPADFPMAFAHTVCGSVSACCALSPFGFDEATCIANAAQSIQRELPPPDQSVVVFDATAAASCLTALAAFLGQCTPPAGQTIPEVCEHVRIGLVPIGGACMGGGQCDPGARADTGCTGSGALGICTAPPKLGDPCNETCTSSAIDPVNCPGCSWGSRTLFCRASAGGSNAACLTNDGLYCSGSGSCASLPSPGEPCPEGVCPPGSMCVDGICGSAVGQPCGGGFDCAYADAYCDATKLCAALLSEGSPCTSAYQCESTQCTLGRCTRSLASDDLCGGLVAL